MKQLRRQFRLFAIIIVLSFAFADIIGLKLAIGIIVITTILGIVTMDMDVHYGIEE